MTILFLPEKFISPHREIIIHKQSGYIGLGQNNVFSFLISPAGAHGLSVGVEVDGFGPLIFLPVIFAFACFIYWYLRH